MRQFLYTFIMSVHSCVDFCWHAALWNVMNTRMCVCTQCLCVWAFLHFDHEQHSNLFSSDWLIKCKVNLSLFDVAFLNYSSLTNQSLLSRTLEVLRRLLQDQCFLCVLTPRFTYAWTNTWQLMLSHYYRSVNIARSKCVPKHWKGIGEKPSGNLSHVASMCTVKWGHQVIVSG